MKINRLKISNLRNHIYNDINFDEGFNIISGKNGMGKTTILEAISICSFSKTFLPTLDRDLIRNGEEFYQTSIEAKRDNNVDYTLNVAYKSLQKKRFSGNLGDNLLPKNIIGEVPIVILSPDYKSITFGSPQNRRDFLDRLLSQLSKTYFENLVNYKNSLRQKNSLLLKSKKERYFDFAQIEPWNDILLALSTEIISKRIEFINEFKDFFMRNYHGINDLEAIDILYKPHSIENYTAEMSKADIKDSLLDFYSKNKQIEQYKGSSCFGPHKDDLVFMINKGFAKDYASQGQHKSLLISLKFSEFYYLKEKLNETPIVLFDDIFAELDSERANKVLEMLELAKAQVFITTTTFDYFDNFNSKTTKFFVENGTVRKI